MARGRGRGREGVCGRGGRGRGRGRGPVVPPPSAEEVVGDAGEEVASAARPVADSQASSVVCCKTFSERSSNSVSKCRSPLLL